MKWNDIGMKQMAGRLFGTPQQKVYMNGALPKRLRDNFEAYAEFVSAATVPLNTSGGVAPPRSAREIRVQLDASKLVRFKAYHGHREMLYALGFFLDYEYNMVTPATPVNSMEPGTSIFLELHTRGSLSESSSPAAKARFPDASMLKGSSSQVKQAVKTDEDSQLFVRAFMWAPCDEHGSNAMLRDDIAWQGPPATFFTPTEGPITCPAKQITLLACFPDIDRAYGKTNRSELKKADFSSYAFDCSWERYKAAIDNKIATVGNYAALCEIKHPNAERNVELQQLETRVSALSFVALLAAACFLCVLAVLCLRREATRSSNPISSKFSEAPESDTFYTGRDTRAGVPIISRAYGSTSKSHGTVRDASI